MTIDCESFKYTFHSQVVSINLIRVDPNILQMEEQYSKALTCT